MLKYSDSYRLNHIKSKQKFRRITCVPKQFILFILIVLFSHGLFSTVVHAEKAEAAGEDIILEEQINSDETRQLEDQINKYSNSESKELLPDFNPKSIINDISKGKFDFSIKGLLDRVGRYFFKEIYLNINILIKLMVLVVLCAVLKNLQGSFLSESVGELAFYACYIVIVSILIISLNSALDLGRGIIDNMVGFMHATIPVLITLLISGGNITSGGVFQPILIMIVEISATVMKNFFIPLIFLSTVLSIVDNISGKIQVSKLASFFKQIGTWSLGLILTAFIAVLTIQSSVGAVVDGVTGKTAKFAIGAFIPVAGKYLADAADTVIGCTLLIKNAAGVAVMLAIVSICLIPIIKIFALIALYRITCVLIEPIAEKRIVNCISDMAGSLTFVLGIVASVAFMFLLTVTAIITAGSLSAAVR
jgi:stage III sporulation protein AE